MRKPLWILGLLAGPDDMDFRESSIEFNLRERFKALLRTDLSTANPRGGVVSPSGGLLVSENGTPPYTQVDVAAGIAFDVNAEYVMVEADPSAPADGGPARPARTALTPTAGVTTQYLYIKYAYIDNQHAEAVFRDGYPAAPTASGYTRRWDSYAFEFSATAPSAIDTDRIPLAKLTLDGSNYITAVEDIREHLVLGVERFEPFLVDLPPINWAWPYTHQGAHTGFTGWMLPTGHSLISTKYSDTVGVGSYAPLILNAASGDGDLLCLTGRSWYENRGATSLEIFQTSFMLPSDLHVPVSGDGTHLRWAVYAKCLESPNRLDTGGQFKLEALSTDGATVQTGSQEDIALTADAAWYYLDINLSTLGASAGDIIHLRVSGAGTTPAGLGNAVFIHGRVTGYRDPRQGVRIGL